MTMRRSWRSYLINGFLRATIKRHLSPKFAVQRMRAKFGAIDRWFSRPLTGVTSEKLDMNGLACERISVPGSRDERVLLYVHGGGFVLGVLHAHRDMLARWCEVMGCVAYVPDYRLAPEHPYPAPQDDCFHSYQWLLASGIPAANIVLAGESAGGCLSLSLLQRIRQAGLDMPACAVLMSPATDLTLSGESGLLNERKDPMFTFQTLLLMRNAHVREVAVTESAVSPLFGEFDGLPPLMFQVGSTEMLLSDSVRAAEAAKESGVDVTLDIWPGMPHAFPLLSLLPESRLAKEAIADFVSQHAGWAAV